MFICDTWSKWEFSQISSYPNSCTQNHRCFIRRKIWSIDLTIWIFSLVSVSFCVSMILFNNWIKHISECVVWVMRACIHSNTWINVLTTWEDCILERKPVFVFNIFIPCPNILWKILSKQRLCSWWEFWIACKLIWALQVWSDLNSAFFRSCLLRWLLYRSLIVLLRRKLLRSCWWNGLFEWFFRNHLPVNLICLFRVLEIIYLLLMSWLLSTSVHWPIWILNLRWRSDFSSWWSHSTLLGRWISCKILRYVFSLAIIMHGHKALLSNKLTVWPIPSF